MEIIKNFTTDRDALTTPWVESPFFYDLLESSNLSDDEKEMAIKFHEDGYLILDLELDEIFVDNIINDMYIAMNRDNVKLQAEFYTYSDSPRIFEEWRNSSNIRNLCLHPELIKRSHSQRLILSKALINHYIVIQYIFIQYRNYGCLVFG